MSAFLSQFMTSFAVKVSAVIDVIVASIFNAVSATTSLLIKANGEHNAQNNTFLDSSSNNLTITRTGNVAQGSFSPFAHTAAYSPALHGGSAYFDGSGDYLSIPSTANNFGLNDFTVEAWTYITARNGSFPVLFSVAPMQVYFGHDIGSSVCYVVYLNGYAIISSIPLIYNAWTHIAITRSGTSLKLFINGTQSGGTASNSTNFNSATGTALGTQLDIVSNASKGYISNFRILNGTALYTSNFTPPTAPLTAVANTQLLLNFVNSSITDAACKSDIETVGTAKVSTAVKKFNSSVYFDGTSNLSTSASDVNYIFGSSNFTVEAWVYPTAAVRSNLFGTFQWHSGYRGGWALTYLANGTVTFEDSAVIITSTGTMSTNAWSHVAVVRNGSNFFIFINGLLASSIVSYASTLTAPNYWSKCLRVGGYMGDGGAISEKFTGYIEDLRVTNTAIYATTFTPPVLEASIKTDVNDPYFNQNALVLKASTSSTVLDNNTFLDSSTSALTITRNGNVSQGSFSPFSPNGWSGYFNGSTDYVTVPYSSTLNVDSSLNFSIECWFNTNSTSNQTLLSMRDGDGGVSGYELAVINQKIAFGWDPNTKTNASGVTTIPTNTWVHIAVTYDGTTLRLFKDGVIDASSTSIRTSTVASSTLKIGVVSTTSGTSRWTFGRISNLRVVKGTAVYVTNFTPPTAPLTAIAGTTLLCLQDNRFRDNSVNNFTLTASGTPKTVNSSPFPVATVYSSSVHGGSAHFNGGSGDYLSIPTNTDFAFGTGDFTIDFYAYRTDNNTAYSAILTTGVRTDGNFFGGYVIELSSTRGFYFGVNAAVVISYNTNPIDAQWHHWAITRTGTTVRMFKDGIVVATVTSAVSIMANYNLTIGQYGSSAYFKGFVSDLRILKGTSLYTTNFTLLTAPVTSITNTKILLNCTNAAIVDASSHLLVETTGTAKLSSTQTKFGKPSFYFDGSAGCYLKLPAGSLNFRSNDFTIDFWYYKNAQAPASGRLFQTADGDVFTGFGLFDSIGTLTLCASSNGSSWDVANILGGGTISISAWHHIVLRRVGTIIQVSLNGSIAITVNFSNSMYYIATQTPIIGGQSGTNRTINGYITDFRITIGKGRYTVEPTAAL